MHRQILTPWLMLAFSLPLFVACKQKSKEEADPAPVAAATAAPAEPPAATPAPPETIAPPAQPPAAAPAAAAKPESIKGCCAALHKEETTVAASEKSLYTTAANGCDAISKLVSSGVTKKAAALTQLRASLKGGKLPAGCD